MALFNQILDAISNPEKEANPSQLSAIINTINTLSQNYDANPSTINSAISVVGKYTKIALQEKREEQGETGVEELINQFAGTNANNQIVEILFSSPQLQNLMQEVETKTGISQDTAQEIVPVLVPLVLNFLQAGSNSDKSLGNNPILSSFLDADGDGDVDIADAIKLAGKYI